MRSLPPDLALSDAASDAGPPPADAAPEPAMPARNGPPLLLLAAQVIRFGMVGGLGFLWDAASVYALRPLVGVTAAALGAYLVAATMNWMLNRVWTFRDRGRDEIGAFRQWLGFLGANAFGFALNRSLFFLLVQESPLCAAHLILPLAAGSLAGMGANFTLSKRVVFRA